MDNQIPFPSSIPKQFNVETFQEPVYDFNVHINLNMPEYVVNLKFEKFYFDKFDLENENDRANLNKFLESGIAFTSPFNVLSPEGLRVLSNIIEYHKENTPQLSKQTNRQAWW